MANFSIFVCHLISFFLCGILHWPHLFRKWVTEANSPMVLTLCVQFSELLLTAEFKSTLPHTTFSPAISKVSVICCTTNHVHTSPFWESEKRGKDCVGSERLVLKRRGRTAKTERQRGKGLIADQRKGNKWFYTQEMFY